MMPHLDIKAVRARALQRYVKPEKQRGVVLLIALIALVAMLLAGIALVRSVDTGNVIAGNLAFKQAALQISDTGTEAALTALTTTIQTSLDADIPGQYFATIQPVDANGIPTTISWSTVPIVTLATGSAPGYKIRYVIDRLCQGPTPVTDIQGKCFADTPLGGGSQSANAYVFSSASVVYYRVTVRVEGPRNTVSMVQTLLSY